MPRINRTTWLGLVILSVAAQGGSAAAAIHPLQDGLRITEIMYHPAEPSPAELAAGHADADLFEFIELFNIGSTTLDLTRVDLLGGLLFSFTGSAVTNLAPGELALVVANVPAFEQRYGTGLPVAGSYFGTLSNGGERITAFDQSGVQIHDFTYDDLWHPTTDGDGYSLTIRDAGGPLSAWSEAAGWAPSDTLGGTPGVHGAAAVVPEPSSAVAWSLLGLIAAISALAATRPVHAKSLLERKPA